MTTHAPLIGGLEARRPFTTRLGPKGALVYKLYRRDHHPDEGLGSAVLEALVGKEKPPLRLAHLAVRIMPGSGTPSELLASAPRAQRRSAATT